ncbi:O-methyltransferase [Catonella morbi ATCC 51271]|uniref:tRNA 5-hydroxyuridine methyltransferase n=1 Tax=Catonella morbi ATCC 51271 TaxID=592026 RepID=V2Y9M4_9FIRM|nr:O-methyltransferase [Catonella morbi]ESL04376.1 O-methyltransferase [Catonella morbi ATCC 51271]
MMVEHERFESFLESIPDGLPEYLTDFEIENIKENIPIIRKGSQRIIRFMLEMKKPLNILEVGTATGFSSVFMLEFLNKKAKITTIEKMEDRVVKAEKNFNKFDKNKQITLIEGDATDILSELVSKDKTYDFIFMDAAKGQYINFFENIKKLLVSGGILITDNMLQEGRLLDSRYTVVRRDRTIHRRMREYVNALLTDKEFETMLLESGDGMAVSIKK